MPVQLTSAYQDALGFAIQLHAGQTRKGTDIPYISHLLAVSATVLEFGGTEEEAIAALLHDAVEDAGGSGTRAEIADKFGEPVAQVVEECSDDSPEPGAQKRPWRVRKEAHIKHIEKASAPVLLVTAADKLHNARAIAADHRELGNSLWARFNAPPEDILWYYRAMVSALKTAFANIPSAVKVEHAGMRGLRHLINELEVTVRHLHHRIDTATS